MILNVGDNILSYTGQTITIDSVEPVPAGLLFHGTFDIWAKLSMTYEAQVAEGRSRATTAYLMPLISAQTSIAPLRIQLRTGLSGGSALTRMRRY